MITKLKRLVPVLSLLSLWLVPLLAAPVAVFAQSATEKGLCAGSNFTVDTAETCDVTVAGADGKTATTRVNSIITTIINIFSVVVGVVAVIMIIVGGLKYITSGGDSGNITSAKNTILYAIVGLIVVALAQIIVRFVLAKATGAPTTL